jgi:transposase
LSSGDHFLLRHRLELLLIQIAELEQSRDAVLEDENPDRAAGTIQQLAKLRGVGVQSATLLVREGFVREFSNGKAVVSYETVRRYLIPLVL